MDVSQKGIEVGCGAQSTGDNLLSGVSYLILYWMRIKRIKKNENEKKSEYDS